MLKGALSNNVLNSGADSFNTTTTTIKHSYNTVNVAAPKPPHNNTPPA